LSKLTKIIDVMLALRIFSFSFLAISLFELRAQNNIQKIENVFPLKWKTYIGQTTYRTNILLHQNKIWVGSNGNTLDRVPNDENDAVFAIEPQTGKILEKIKPTYQNLAKELDTDVNGIAIDGNKLFFGTDLKSLYCYDIQTKQFLWQYNTPNENPEGNTGNIESCPLLTDLNADSENDVVITIRGKGVAALNGKTGKVLWLNVLTNDDGAFLTSPCAVDVNADGILDIITGGWDKTTFGRESLVYALNGKNGEIIWKFALYSGLKSSPIVVKKGKKTAIMVANTYSIVFMIDLQGKLLYAIDLNMPEQAPYYGGISGLYASPVLTPNETMGIGSSWWSSDEQDGFWLTHLQKAPLVTEKDLKFVDKKVSKFFPANRITASAVVAQINAKNWQMAVPTEKGKLLIYDEKTKMLQTLLLPAGSEATPFVGDIDKDKKLELLIATYDGNLYCYQLPLKKAKVFIGQFRQDNKNQANIRLK
jgi:outer membrane protein assembly factor BamB